MVFFKIFLNLLNPYLIIKSVSYGDRKEEVILIYDFMSFLFCWYMYQKKKEGGILETLFLFSLPSSLLQPFVKVTWQSLFSRKWIVLLSNLYISVLFIQETMVRETEEWG